MTRKRIAIYLLYCIVGVGVGMLGGCQQPAQWQTLFDGSDTDAWRGFKQDSFPDTGWLVEDDALVFDPDTGRSGDIITREKYGNFELELEFKLTEAANSGIKYFILEELARGRNPLGPEYQILDDERHPDADQGREGTRQLASLYDVLAARADKPVRPIGQWNSARLISRDGRIEHWLNGAKVLEYRRDDPKLLEFIEMSKFKDNDSFIHAITQLDEGHIALQDHADKVYYRNIRIRRLD